ncbi:glycoside hydrolase family 3 C-terminal domain-containing protein [Seonamhaeicola sp.]|uniref:glycoside hydrolase family 3 C-terminal domain-containing protein n=1 Tax=Seonamhaeicola sp. TaxID=1912245 RepID=UPI0026124BB4|nr:glycoside hydrolase family 3 C-terminal domain-containing protein [Seonamhaeicola sp.]
MRTEFFCLSRRPLRLGLFIIYALVGMHIFGQSEKWFDTDLSFESRVEALVSEMTLDEKVQQLGNITRSINRLGIPKYNYMGEALHGIAEMAGGLYFPATSFPQSIAMGSTWNPELMYQVSTAISDEARAYYNMGQMDLTFWSPNINVLRDPRWGRNDEAFTEDPYLMSKMGVAFVKGLQGNDPKYLKTVASPKHFVANNSEFNRHDGNSEVKERWLREYYFPAFKAAVQDGKAFSTMCAYNRVNGVPACGNEWLLNQVLRNEWGFSGYVVSDCGAIEDVFLRHKFKENAIESAVLGINAGCELNCGDVYENYLNKAVKKGLIEESVINAALKKLLVSRFKMGMFDPKEDVPYSNIQKDVIESPKHQALALRAAQESIILLKSNHNTLPLSKDIKSIAIIGPNANATELGGYSGRPSRKITPLDGLKQRLDEGVALFYERGCNITTPDKLVFDVENRELAEKAVADDLEAQVWMAFYEDYKKEVAETDDVLIPRAVELAKKVDQVVLVMGTNVFISAEGTDAENLEWPGNQRKLIREIYKVNKNVVLVTVKGYQIDLRWENENLPAIVEAWYGGQEQGLAIADVLLGNVNPSGKLPVTYYATDKNLPHIADYDITKNRTYWFHEEKPLFPFGFGLSYTDFDYSSLKITSASLDSSAGLEVKVSFKVKNIGGMDGKETVQLYVKDLESKVIQPNKRLKRFKKVDVKSGETKVIEFTLNNEDFQFWDEAVKGWNIEPGDFEIQVGSSSEDILLRTKLVIQ